MGCEAGCGKTSTLESIFIVTPLLEGWPIKIKEAPSPHELKLAPLDTKIVVGTAFKRVWLTNCKTLSYCKTLHRNNKLSENVSEDKI